MGLGRGRTITSEWKGSNPVTPSQIRWRGKEENREKEVERVGGTRLRRGLHKCRAIRCGGMGKMCFYGQRRVP